MGGALPFDVLMISVYRWCYRRVSLSSEPPFVGCISMEFTLSSCDAEVLSPPQSTEKLGGCGYLSIVWRIPTKIVIYVYLYDNLFLRTEMDNMKGRDV